MKHHRFWKQKPIEGKVDLEAPWKKEKIVMHRLPVRKIATRRILLGPEYMSQEDFGPELVELATCQNNLCKMSRLI